MQIGIVSHSYPTNKFPARGKFIQDEAHLLASSETVTVFLPTVFAPFFRSNHSDIVAEIFPIYRIPYLSFPKKRFPRIIRKNLSRQLATFLKRHQLDILHVHGLYPSGLILPNIKDRELKTVLTIHGSDWYETRKNAQLRNLLNTSLQSVNQIIVASDSLKKDILKENPDLEIKINTIPFGVDTSFFQPPKDKTASQKRLGWREDITHFLCVANMWRVKGLDILLEAISLELKDPKYQFHFVSPPRDPDYQKELQTIIQKNDLNNVHFYPEKERAALLHFYQAADVLISPSRREGFGITLIEAAATGLPIIATKSGGPEQIVVPEIGYLVDKENPEELSSAIRKMVVHLDDFAPRNISNNMIDRFSLFTKKERLIALYQQLLSADG